MDSRNEFGHVVGEPPKPQLAEYADIPLGAAHPGDLTLPLYGATFGQALNRFFRNYARFSGRASRSEFWWIQMAMLLLAVGIALLFVAAANASPDGAATYGVLAIIVLAVIVCVVPSWALLVRRLHDADAPGWLALLTLVPYIGGVLVIVFGVMPAKALGERFDRR